MKSFDVTKVWEILIPTGMPVAQKVGNDLSRCIALLRRQTGLAEQLCPVKNSDISFPDDTVPVIVLNAEAGGRERNGFSWRVGKERIELYGESDRGLCNAVFDFLAALGFRWPKPDEEVLPESRDEYHIEEEYTYQPSSVDTMYRRLLFWGKDAPETWEKTIVWAARNRIDALVFSLRSQLMWNKLAGTKPERFFFFLKKPMQPSPSRDKLLALAEEYALSIEMGGWDLSCLLPRTYYKRHKDFFRMNDGKREQATNFCPTNSDTLAIIRQEAEKVFRAYPNITVYHFWPDRGYETAWCSCPTCRAFNTEEQNRIALGTVADVLRDINPKARISCFENSNIKNDIALRPNLFIVGRLPGNSGAEASGWFLSETKVLS
ncbi:MAG: DUF4838 domain-containing protein [Treponema sp.]|jgi:hypothetical protein|nr:DUF4838 domain-containing protein [Treponema sp.]